MAAIDESVGDLHLATVVINVQDMNREVDFWPAAAGYVRRERDWDPEFMVLVDPSRQETSAAMPASRSARMCVTARRRRYPADAGYRGAGRALPCCLPRPGAPRARRHCPSRASGAGPAGRSARPWSDPRSACGPCHGRAWLLAGLAGLLLLGLLGLLAGGLLGLAGLLVREVAGRLGLPAGPGAG